MKKVYSISATIFFICFLLQACSKQSINDEISPGLTNIINTTIAPNQNYNIAIREPGEVTIIKQAKHYKTSKINFGQGGTQTIYTYMPAQDYSGMEEIILTTKKSNVIIYGGCNSNHNANPFNTSYTTTYTLIRINISN